jgi:hypothetical protein
LSPVSSEIRYAARKFLRTPKQTLALLVTIALGIGSNVSVYGFIRGLTKPGYLLPVREGVVSLLWQNANRVPGPLTRQEYLSVKSDVNAFEWVGAARVSTIAVTTSGQSAVVSAESVRTEGR